MNVDDFWSILQECREGARGDCARTALNLRGHLQRLSLDEIRSYIALYRGAEYALSTWDLKGVALLGGIAGPQNDSFDYFRGWIIMQGPSTFRRAIDEPEDFVLDLLESGGDVWCEQLLSVGTDAYLYSAGEVVDSNEMWSQVRSTAEDVFGLDPGEPWEDLNDLRDRFPRLYAKTTSGPASPED